MITDLDARVLAAFKIFGPLSVQQVIEKLKLFLIPVFDLADEETSVVLDSLAERGILQREGERLALTPFGLAELEAWISQPVEETDYRNRRMLFEVKCIMIRHLAREERLRFLEKQLLILRSFRLHILDLTGIERLQPNNVYRLEGLENIARVTDLDIDHLERLRSLELEEQIV